MEGESERVRVCQNTSERIELHQTASKKSHLIASNPIASHPAALFFRNNVLKTLIFPADEPALQITSSRHLFRLFLRLDLLFRQNNDRGALISKKKRSDGKLVVLRQLFLRSELSSRLRAEISSGGRAERRHSADKRAHGGVASQRQQGRQKAQQKRIRSRMPVAFLRRPLRSASHAPSPRASGYDKQNPVHLT
ncbi:hypothetical protein SABR111722_13955 [Saccharibacillus brassicae]